MPIIERTSFIIKLALDKDKNGRAKMIHVGVGHSHDLSTTGAAEEATRMAMGNAGIAKADIAIVFATINYQTEYDQLYQGVHAYSSCDELIGCSGMSVLTSVGEFEEEPALAVMVLRSEQISAVSFSAQGTEFEIGEQVHASIESQLQDNSLLMIFPDIRVVNPAELVNQIGSDGTTLPVVGAAVSGDATGAQMYHWKGTHATEGGATGLLLTGNFSTEIGVAQGCQPIGKPSEVTKVDDRVIFELDGEPALENFKNVLQLLTQDDIRRSGGTVFIGIVMDNANKNPTRGDFLIRNLVDINEEHAAIEISEEVKEGQLVQLHLRNPLAAAEEIRTIIARLAEKTRQHPPDFGLYFNCLGRGKGLYGAANHDISVIQEQFPGLPVIGFFGNSEFAPIGGRNFAHAYTGVFVLCSGN